MATCYWGKAMSKEETPVSFRDLPEITSTSTESYDYNYTSSVPETLSKRDVEAFLWSVPEPTVKLSLYQNIIIKLKELFKWIKSS